MKQHDFEVSVLRLWTQTRIPLTRTNLLVATEVPRARIDGWLTELVRDGVLEVDSDAEGELLWRVRGAVRPNRGPATVNDLHKLAKLRDELDGASPSTLAVRPSSVLLGPSSQRPEHKSVLASGLLSLVFGPFGWLYAAPLRESLAGILVFSLVTSLVPMFALRPLMGVLVPLIALGGVVYAWRYNRTGRRQSLLGGGDAPRD